MISSNASYRDQFLEELNRIPAEHYSYLHKIIRAYRESVTLPAASESFRQGWQEAMADDTRPISELWKGLDAE